MWGGFLTAELRGALIGPSEEGAVETILAQVEGLKLNGREIKTIVQNAVTTGAFARATAGGKRGPAGEGALDQPGALRGGSQAPPHHKGDPGGDGG